MSATRRRRAPQRGQALLETAITIPLMLVLLLGFMAVLVRVEAQLELDAATSLAAAAAVAAPAASPLSAAYARQTWSGTLRQYPYLQPGSLDGCAAYQPGETVTCRGSATLDYRETPMGLVIPLPIHLQSAATARSSEFRSR
jgi:Flp pilus assembly protein TadG